MFWSLVLATLYAIGGAVIPDQADQAEIRYGIRDLAGKTVVEARFHQITRIGDTDSYRVIVCGKDGAERPGNSELAAHGGSYSTPGCSHGVIDRNGAEIVKPHARNIGVDPLAQWFIVTRHDGKSELLDAKGTALTKLEYKTISPAKPGFVVEHGRQWGYLHEDGRVALAPTLEYAQSFSDGVAWVKRAGRFELIDTGYRALDVRLPELTRVNPFDSGVARVNVKLSTQAGAGADKRRSRSTYIDKSGNEILPAVISVGGAVVANRHEVDISYVGRGIATYTTRNGLKGVTDLAGKEILPANYSRFMVDQNWIIFTTSKSPARVGISDRNGRILLEPRYRDIVTIPAHKVAWVQTTESLWGLLDVGSGRFIVEPRMAALSPLRASSELVELTTHAVGGHPLMVGVMNSQGRWVVPARYGTKVNASDEGFLVTRGLERASFDLEGNPLIGVDRVPGSGVHPWFDSARGLQGFAAHATTEGATFAKVAPWFELAPNGDLWFIVLVGWPVWITWRVRQGSSLREAAWLLWVFAAGWALAKIGSQLGEVMGWWGREAPIAPWADGLYNFALTCAPLIVWLRWRLGRSTTPVRIFGGVLLLINVIEIFRESPWDVLERRYLDMAQSLFVVIGIATIAYLGWQAWRDWRSQTPAKHPQKSQTAA